jgi:hypothetical protein
MIAATTAGPEAQGARAGATRRADGSVSYISRPMHALLAAEVERKVSNLLAKIRDFLNIKWLQTMVAVAHSVATFPIARAL